MICKKCGTMIDSNTFVCPNCGEQVLQSNLETMNTSNSKKSSNNHRMIILLLLFVVVLLLTAASIILVFKDKKNEQVNKRTIMIYMCGSNLETDAGIATADLESIDPTMVDFDTTNILVYTGGTTTWHNNYASSNSNNIIELTEDGYVVVKEEEKKNLGDSETFSSFINYVYENYKADKYDLIIYDHGMGALGSISDDFSNDFLTAFEMKEALEKSYFNENNKMETVLFRTCLNGTSEIASVFAPYANYMVASEEITRGNAYSDVFAFINSIQLSDNGQSFGTKFIAGYKNYMESIQLVGQLDSTYSIIDLSKQKELENALDSFFKDVDVSKNYNILSKIRANMHQYAVDAANVEVYDTVDLYELMYSLRDLSPKKADKVLSIITSMVKENWSINDHSHGLSIYFPYNGSMDYVAAHFGVYDRIDFSKNYFAFIKKFAGIKNGTSNMTTNLIGNNTEMQNKEFSITLSDEQVKEFARGRYIIYEKNPDGTYGLVVRSDAKLNKNTLSAKLYNNIIKISNDKTSTFIPVSEIEPVGNYKEYLTYIVLSKRDDGNYKSDNGNMHLKISNDKVYESEIIKSDKGKEGGIILDPKKYDTLTFEHTRWNLLDNNGNYIGPQKTDSLYVYEFPIKDGYKLELSSLDKGDYYCIFQIYDVKGNVYYSNLEKIN